MSQTLLGFWSTLIDNKGLPGNVIDCQQYLLIAQRKEIYSNYYLNIYSSFIKYKRSINIRLNFKAQC